MSEVWKDIAGYEGKYQVSNLGRVRSISRNTICDSDHRKSHYVRSLDGKILKQSMTNEGYFRVSLYDKDNKLKYVPVHRLVARAFVDGYKEGMQVNHINEMKFVNCAVNLARNMCWGLLMFFVVYKNKKARPANLQVGLVWVYSLNFQKYPLYFEPFFIIIPSKTA